MTQEQIDEYVGIMKKQGFVSHTYNYRKADNSNAVWCPIETIPQGVKNAMNTPAQNIPNVNASHEIFIGESGDTSVVDNILRLFDIVKLVNKNCADNPNDITKQVEYSFYMFGYEAIDGKVFLTDCVVDSNAQVAETTGKSIHNSVIDMLKNKPKFNKDGRKPILVVGHTHPYRPQFFDGIANSWSLGDFESCYIDSQIIESKYGIQCLNANITPSLDLNFLFYDATNKGFYKMPNVYILGQDSKYHKWPTYRGFSGLAMLPQNKPIIRR